MKLFGFGSVSRSAIKVQDNKTTEKLSVSEGLSQLGRSDSPPSAGDSAKHDAQLRRVALQSVTWSSEERQAFSGKDKALKLVALVDKALAQDDPVSAMKGSFSTYLADRSDSKTADRVGKVSQAVHDYVVAHAGSPQADILEDALRSTLASLPLLQKLDIACQKPMMPSDEARFLSSTMVRQVTQLDGGQVNPYIFDKDRSGGIVCRDMTGLVAHANRVLSGEVQVDSRAESLDFLREQVQGKSWSQVFKNGSYVDVSFQEKYESFDKNDLGISQALGNDRNAYTLLGLSPGDPDQVVSARLKTLHDTRYVVEGVAMNHVRNAVFQLQTSEGKADYDLYLRAKTDAGLAAELRQSIVSESDAKVFGLHPRGLRMMSLIDGITQARKEALR